LQCAVVARIIAAMAPFLVEVTEEDIRRERRKARDLRATQWWKRKRAAGVCHHCGGAFAARELTMDHLVPIIRGGKSTKGNVVPSCKPCNSARKHDLPFPTAS
jgi:5-methylcytosine-specific restriction endonuclease McrA